MRNDIKYPNLDNLCRLCLKECNELVSIFTKPENSNKHLSVPMRIMACAALEVQIDDGLPKNICDDCRYQLEKSFYFRNLAQLSNTKLRKHIRLLSLGKRSRVFEKNEEDDDDADELQFEDSLGFIKEQDSLKKIISENNLQKIHQQHKNELEELKNYYEEHMQKTIEERCTKLRKTLYIEVKKQVQVEVDDEFQKFREIFIKETKEELRTQMKQECRETEIKTLLDDMDYYLRKKRVQLLNESISPNSREKNTLDVHKVNKRFRSPEESPKETRLRRRQITSHNENNSITERKKVRHESYEIISTEVQPLGDADNNENINDEETGVEDGAQTDFYIIEDNITEPTDEETLVENESSEYPLLPTDDAGDRTPVYQIETQTGIQTIKDEDGVLYFKVGNNTNCDEEMEMMEFIDLNIEPAERCTTRTTTAFITQSTDKQTAKVTGYTKVVNKVEIQKIGIEEEDASKKSSCGRSTDTPKTFKCDLCTMSFSTMNILNRHYRVHERSKKNGVTYQCSECQLIFSCKSALNRHSLLHTGERPFKCDICGKSFVQREILKRHLQVHSGERPYKCPHCSRTYTQKVNLQQHINHNHSKMPKLHDHMCHLCPKRFNHASGLSRHLASHSGVSYQCIECERCFGDRSSVKRHVMNVHTAEGASSDSADKFIKECSKRTTSQTTNETSD